MRDQGSAPVVGVGVETTDVESRFLIGCRRRERQQGRCFDAALAYLFHNGNPHLRLIHGTVNQPIVYDHAWVLLPVGVVFDPVDQDFYPQASYSAQLGAVSEVVYCVREARAQLATHGHAGPWHKARAEAVVKDAWGRPTGKGISPLIGWENLKAALTAFALVRLVEENVDY